MARLAWALVLAGAAPVASAQPLDVEPHWVISGELGGTLGARWLSGGGAPSVRSGTGVAVGVAAERRSAARVAPGVSLRVAMQPVTLREAGLRWDGGTLTDTQLFGTLSLLLRDAGGLRAAAEAGAGAAFLSGTNAVVPLSTAARMLPAGEVGVALSRSFTGSTTRKRSAFDLRAFTLVARYGVMRLDPAGRATVADDLREPVAGWVGRLSLGLRVAK